MMKDYDLVRKANDYVFQLFQEKLSKKYVYHNYKHTFEVVKECKQLAETYHLGPEETEVLLLAAWFHDTGYTQEYNGHEEVSATLAESFLNENQYPREKTEQVKSLIMATVHQREPTTLLEEIIKDADLSSIGKDSFFSTAELLRVEWEIFLDKTFSKTEWAEYQLDFLMATNFYTEAAQKKYAEQLGLNIQEQRKQLKRAKKKKAKEKAEKQETLAQPKRGIETMFRNVYSVHTNLSSMADSKANMMISVNAIILSIIITYTGAKTGSASAEVLHNPVTIIPIAVLLLTTLTSVIFAIISAQPEVTSLLKPGRKTVRSENVNLLFFGNFNRLSLAEFENGMVDIMRDKQSLYNNMIMDIYYLGDVLTRKYRLLRISYTFFMVGLILTVLAFIGVFLYTKGINDPGAIQIVPLKPVE